MFLEPNNGMPIGEFIVLLDHSPNKERHLKFKEPNGMGKGMRKQS